MPSTREGQAGGRVGVAHVVQPDRRLTSLLAVADEPHGDPARVDHPPVLPGEDEAITVLPTPVTVPGHPLCADRLSFLFLGVLAFSQRIHGGRVKRHDALAGGGL